MSSIKFTKEATTTLCTGRPRSACSDRSRDLDENSFKWPEEETLSTLGVKTCKTRLVSKDRSCGREEMEDKIQRERRTEREEREERGVLATYPNDQSIMGSLDRAPSPLPLPLCPCRSCITLYEFNFNREKFSIWARDHYGVGGKRKLFLLYYAFGRHHFSF